MNEQLQQSILSTLAYFDVFDYPLTAEELYRALHALDADTMAVLSTGTFDQVLIQLQDLVENGRIEMKDSMFFLPGRIQTVVTRQLAIPTIEKKLRIARRAVRLIRWIPFVYGVWVCNTLASGTVKDESDIDVFIIIKEGRMWSTRFLITIVLSVFRLRRTQTRVANKICLSYYITTNHLNLHDVVIDQRDIYTWYWIDQLVPVYDRDNIYDCFQKNNQWVKSVVPHALQPVRLASRYRVNDGVISKRVRSFLERLFGKMLGDWIEGMMRWLQQVVMERSIPGTRPYPTSVVVSDTMLKFHENDRRGFFRSEWEKRLMR